MKKFILASILVTISLFTSCSNPNNDTTNQNEVQLNYSNLVDEKTQSEVFDILKDSTIKDENINDFLKKVNDYNKKVGKNNLSKDGFITINTQQVSYDEGKLLDMWNSKSNTTDEIPLGDLNCRLTSFELFKDYIISEDEFTGDTIDLMFDLDTIERNPLAKMNATDVKKFTNVFSAIPAEDTTDVKKHAETIKNEWSKRNVTFLKNSKVSLINVFLHYTDTKNLLAGHSGILIQDNNEFIFIEKYAPMLPYQVTKFKTKRDLSVYLLDRLNVYTDVNGSSPIIMENNELMELN